MRGSRVKALRRAFKYQFNRTVRGPEVKFKEGELVGYIPSEWRRLKKAYKEARRKGLY